MRYLLLVLCMLLGPVTSANAQLNISFGTPGISIGINLGGYPDLVQVPGYPVYYAPRLSLNLFFYDGMYWAYQRDEWYASSWYNGPWGIVDRMVVPFYVLRVPVRYYRDPPQYFRGWRQDAPPRWGQHWGNQWEERRRGWDQWDRKSVPRPAPLPVYQRQYSGDRYPRVEQQRELHSQNYRYQPREVVVREHYKEQTLQRKPEASQRREQGASQEKGGGKQDSQRSNPAPQSQQGGAPVPRSQPQQGSGQREQQMQKGDDGAKRPVPAPAPQKGSKDKDQGRQPQQGAGQREQQSPRANQENNPHDKGASQDSRQRQDQDKGREKGEGKGQDRNN